MKHRTTLDIDLIPSKYSCSIPKSEQFILDMLKKICQCKNILGYSVRPSSFKGYHIELFCKIECDICRMCYDDEKRFCYDMNRPYYARNIFFESKEKVIIE